MYPAIITFLFGAAVATISYVLVNFIIKKVELPINSQLIAVSIALIAGSITLISPYQLRSIDSDRQKQEFRVSVDRIISQLRYRAGMLESHRKTVDAETTKCIDGAIQMHKFIEAENNDPAFKREMEVRHIYPPVPIHAPFTIEEYLDLAALYDDGKYDDQTSTISANQRYIANIDPRLTDLVERSNLAAKEASEGFKRLKESLVKFLGDTSDLSQKNVNQIEMKLEGLSAERCRLYIELQVTQGLMSLGEAGNIYGYCLLAAALADEDRASQLQKILKEAKYGQQNFLMLFMEDNKFLKDYQYREQDCAETSQIGLKWERYKQNIERLQALK